MSQPLHYTTLHYTTSNSIVVGITSNIIRGELGCGGGRDE